MEIIFYISALIFEYMSKKPNQIPTPKVTASIKPTTFIVENKDDVNDVASVAPLIEQNSIWQKLSKGWMPYAIIAIFGLILNANTFNHEYALDDDIIVCKNQFVLKGIAGIPEIMKYDVFESFYRSMNTTAQLAGGRYRPFALATYALEQEFIGTMHVPDSVTRIKDEQQNMQAMNAFLVQYFANSWDVNKNKIQDKNEDVNGDGQYNEYDYKITGMHFRHVNNVLLYTLSVCIIFLFLSTFFFKDNKMMALLISLLFLAHPIHTEVVANVKSRDEILSLLFMVLTMYHSFMYIRERHWKYIAYACISYLIALMSKEYGASLMIIVPMSLYVYYKKVNIFKYAPLMVGLGIAFAVYYFKRSTVVIEGSPLQDTELLNNPYLFATDAQKSATQMFINLKYLLLLLVPTPLSCDYSYNVIPFRENADPLVILSALLLLTFGVLFVRSLIKRSWLAFPIGFALLHLFLVNNLFFNIGATMGERLVYHSSLGICILLVWGANEIFHKLNVTNSMAYAMVILPIVLLYGAKTIARNPAWKNDVSLHLTDVQTYPESTMLNGNACTRLIELSEKPVIVKNMLPANMKNDSMANVKQVNVLLDSAKIFGGKSLKLHDKFVNSFLNMGIIMAKQNKMDSASYFWEKVRYFYPHHPQLAAIDQSLTQNFYTKAMNYANVDKNLPMAIAELEKALKVTPNNAKLLYDIGGMNFNIKNYLKAKEYWSRGIQLAPQDPQLLNGMNTLRGMGL
jgi:protein O-mannosyl-transferase